MVAPRRDPASPAPAAPDAEGVASRRSGWLGAIGALLGVALLVVAAVQWRQWAQISQTMLEDEGPLVVDSHRAEFEYLRLKELWPQRDDPRPVDATLVQQYEVFVGRLRRLAGDEYRAQRAGLPELETAAAVGEAFVARADPLFAALRTETPPATALLLSLAAPLERLGPPLQELSRHAALLGAQRVEHRREVLAQHNRIGVALTIFLSVLTLAFALISLRQLRRLEARREVLEQLTATLREARRGAEAASAAKSAFLANMSHELRTPFQGLLGMLSLLRETGLAPRQMDYLRTATESADHLLQILNDILDMSQLESGRLTLNPTVVELRSLLRDVEALMRPQALRKNLGLHLGADPGVPERAQLDATRVKQVLFNLLANGIKFSDRGDVGLDLRVTRGERGEVLEFVVSDTGIGMDEATVERLFRRFSQGDTSRSRRHGGAGLGLEISRDLARLMGGDITVRSRPGQGSVFTFSVPLVAAPAAAPSPHAAQAPGVEPAAVLSVLVAEDHDVNRQYLEAVLDSLGHRSHFVPNGELAVAAVKAQRYDLVLMDLHMPVMDGIAATRAIRALADPVAAAVPIYALTADAFPETRQRCLLAGMNDFLTKPIVPQALAASLRRLFGRAYDGSGAAAPLPAPAPPASQQAVRPLRPESLAAPAAVLDQAAINRTLQAMSRERLRGLMQIFFDDAPATLDRLRAAVRDAQPLDLRVHAHALRGAALNLGLAGIAATAESLREGASHLPAHEIALLVQRFESQLSQARDALSPLGLAPEAIP
jgi:signal transduction histidine kinase/DNA-binding response OmpR family regulator